MTPKQLSVLTRKELVEIARSHQVSGWHGMRKQQLVDAVSKIKSPKRKSRGHTGPQTNRRASRTPISNHQHKSLSERPARTAGVRRRSTASMFRRNEQAQDRIVVRALDSEWLQVEWELCAQTLDRAHAALGIDWHQSTPSIRLYDVTSDDLQMETKQRVHEVVLSGHTNRWYIPVPKAARDYKVQIGLLTPDSRFFLLSQSRKIRVPAGASQASSPQQHIGWGTPSPGNESQPTQMHWSQGETGPDRAAEPPQTSGFAFHIDAELTIRGAVAQGTDLTILDQRVPVSKDGSFAIQIPLADGRQVLPAVAVSPDGTEKRTKVLAIERNTKELEPQTHNRYAE